MKICLFRGENLNGLSTDELEILEKDLNTSIKKINVKIEMNKNSNDFKVDAEQESIKI